MKVAVDYHHVPPYIYKLLYLLSLSSKGVNIKACRLSQIIKVNLGLGQKFSAASWATPSHNQPGIQAIEGADIILIKKVLSILKAWIICNLGSSRFIPRRTSSYVADRQRSAFFLPGFRPIGYLDFQ
jgi:hypothetical protein